MMYITQNFHKGSSIAYQMLFDLNMVDMPDKKPTHRVRVARPPEVEDEPAKPDFSNTPGDNPPIDSTAEQNTDKGGSG